MSDHPRESGREIDQLREIAELADVYMGSPPIPETRIPLGRALVAWRASAPATRTSPQLSEGLATKLLNDALFLRQYGERPPGAPKDDPDAETWRAWDVRCEVYLRALTDQDNR